MSEGIPLCTVACNDFKSFNNPSTNVWYKIVDVHFEVVYRSQNATQEYSIRSNELLLLTDKRRLAISFSTCPS